MNRKPKECAVCVHPDLKQINSLLIKGASYASICRQYGLPDGAVSRHAKYHLSRHLAVSAEVAAKVQGLSMVDELLSYIEETKKILVLAKEKGQNHLALAALKELRGHANTILSAQAFVWQTQQKKESPEDIIEDYKENQSYAIKEGLKVLSPTELKVYNAITMKMISGHRSMDIPHLDYVEGEKRPYEVDKDGNRVGHMREEKPEAAPSNRALMEDKDNSTPHTSPFTGSTIRRTR